MMEIEFKSNEVTYKEYGGYYVSSMKEVDETGLLTLTIKTAEHGLITDLRENIVRAIYRTLEERNA